MIKKEDSMNRRYFYLIAVNMVMVVLFSSVTFAASPYYEGKVIRLLVGVSPGGGFDTYARTIARHMGKHIPGQPKIIVENMVGANHLIAANYIYKVAKPDGLTMCHITGNLYLRQMFGVSGVEFDARKFVYIGAPIKEWDVVVLSKKRGVTSIDQWINSKTPVRMGATGHLGDIGSYVRIIKATTGLPIDLIEGYKGTAEIRMAVESGELDGTVLMWDSAKATWRNALEKGDVSVLFQMTPKPLPDIPNVPQLINLAKTDESKKLIELGIHNLAIGMRPFATSPGTPEEQKEILRNAFQKTMKDREFLAETEKARMGIDPLTGEELEKVVDSIFKSDPDLLAKLKKIISEK